MNNDAEIWEPIRGFPHYEISNMGRVRSWWPRFKVIPRICVGNLDVDGYRKIVLTARDSSKRTFKFASLVARAFLGKRPKTKEVAHSNGMLTDDRVDNLEYKTHRANIADKIKHGTIARGERHGMSKLRRAEVIKIRSDTRRICEIASDFKISSPQVSAIKTKRNWAWL